MLTRARARRGAPPPDDGASPLLCALAALDDGVWAEALLPKLRADKGSAPAFALACREARRLRFTGCSEVAFALGSPGDAGAPLATLLAALARLPRLTSLRLDAAASAAASEPAAIAPAVSAVAAQLPGLRSLQLALGSGWEGRDAAWRAVGLATQLTRVAVRFDQDVHPAVTLRHLPALTAINGLASLVVDVGTLRRTQHYGFLASLPALTQLQLPLVCDHQGVPAIGACTGLRDLLFEAGAQAERVAAVRGLAGRKGLRMLDLSASDDAQVAALAAATQVTELLLRVPAGSACTPAGVMGMARMTVLRTAWLELLGLELRKKDAQAWLRALRFVQEVFVSVANEGQCAMWAGAVAEARPLGIARPGWFLATAVQPRPSGSEDV
ncbi:hypothetical protein HT031_003825 [Scenedesmus sp. PABB004]|nr:hypothetical protein HT031_003825 [Scenedesmus sp. PABB004]